MQIANMGKWFKGKLSSMRSKEKAKPYTPPAPRYRMIKPYWWRNQLHYTAGAIARGGRTLMPHCVARAMSWRANRIGLLTKLAQGNMASPKQLRELRRISH